MVGTDFWLQFLLVLMCLFYGARKGGIALGFLGGVGLIVLTFVFSLPAGKPPIDVILTILAVVCASSTLQSAGGLDCLLQVAEKFLRKHPRYVCFFSPYVCWFLTVLCGTGHVVYTMLPVIYDISIKNNIRPERPMAASSIASQMGIICSPAAVATVSSIAMLEGYTINGEPFDFIDLFAITIPGGFIGVFFVGLFSMFRGQDLDRDEKFQKLIAKPEMKKYVYGETTTLMNQRFNTRQWFSLWLFLGIIGLIALLGMYPEFRPTISGTAMSMTQILQVIMLTGGALMIIFCGVNASDIAKNSVFRAGVAAVVAVYGVVWMTDTMLAAHLDEVQPVLLHIVKESPWTYAVVLLLVSKLVNSQGAALAIVVPAALGVGVPPGIIIAFSAACYGYYILPTYPSDLAAIQFDRSGTTHIGRFVINHSFIAPGLIGVISASITGYILATIYNFI